MEKEHFLKILAEGLKPWNDWRQQNPDIYPDLSNTDFTNVEIFGRYFKNNKIDFTNINFKNCTLINCNFSNCNFKEANFRKSNITLCKFDSSIIIHSYFDGVVAKNSSFAFANAEFTMFRNADLELSNLDCGTFTNCEFNNSIFEKTQFSGTDFSGSNFLGLDTYFPAWGVNVFGTPCFPNYPKRIESIRGLQLYTKKIISDAEYLEFIWKQSENNLIKRLLLRIWGMSCKFGQSIMRWAFTSILFVFLFSFIYLFINMNVATYDQKENMVKMVISEPDFISSLYYSTVTFATLGYGDIVPFTPLGRITAIVEVFIGYLMLGGLVSIFSNKLAKLT